MNAPFIPGAPERVRELVIDAFAGGGGASTGIRMALGRDPDIALNHDRFALAMHRVNHSGTRHMLQDVATVDSVSMCAGLPIGMLWMSPDCTDHSKAKGAAPRREEGKTTRGIGWAIVGWIKALPAWQRPRVVFLENVEEYVDWGPLRADGKRCPVRKGETFNAFVKAWEDLGYGKIEWRIRRAWKAGAGTIRRRLYMIMRRDGEPIVWPEPTHGDPNVAADLARIEAGELKLWVTAADSIDFSLPIPSIFDTREEIKRKLGINAKRPLAPKTGARIAKGVKRHVLEAARRFLVKVNHTARDEARDRSPDVPISAMTGKRDDALVMPFVAGLAHGDSGSRRHYSALEPLTTVHAGGGNHALVTPVLVGCGGRAGQSEPRPGDTPVLTQTGKADLCLVAPFLAYAQQGGATRPALVPTHTFTASSKDTNVLIAPYLVPRYGERAGQAPRSRSVEQPGPTPVPDGNEGSLVAVHISRQFGASVGSDADDPLGTVTAGGCGKSALVAAFLAQHNGGPRPGAPGHRADEPASTITTTGAQQALISVPLLTCYYGSDEVGGSAAEPMRTDTARPRFGLVSADAAVPPFAPEHEARARQVAEFLRAHGCWDGGEFVTLEIDGIPYVIVDICMRMLTPRERYNAQGFPRDYIIDHGLDENGAVIPFSLERQGHMCGNSVCPPEAAALVAANYQPREVQVPRQRGAVEAPVDLFQGERAA